MAAMKSDMGGAAAAVAAVVAIAALKLPVDVTATVPMVENMPSGTAYHPSDVLRMYDGSTVEVGDTDAEGRIILADAVARAAEDDPDYLIEASTLTGAQIIALGPKLIGAMGTEAWRDEVVAAARAAGEGIWPMPLTADLRTRLDSPVADMANIASERWGGMLLGGRFLGEFVPDGPALGAPGHRRPGVQPGRPARLHAEGRHRRRGPDDDRRGRTPRRAADRLPSRRRHRRSGAAELPHAPRVADRRRVVERDRPARRRRRGPTAVRRSGAASTRRRPPPARASSR